MDLTGAWRRSRIIRGDGRVDTTTHVRWLQGRELYVDLRQPAGKPAFDTVSSVYDLDAARLDWMTEQLAFAGRLSTVDGVTSWGKVVDLHPVEPDVGRLSFEGGMLVEESLDDSYVEHWHRTGETTTPLAEAELVNPVDGRRAVVLRAGPLLGFASSRQVDLPTGLTLADVLAAQPDLRARQEIFDCEVFHAVADHGRWTVTRSSQPWREGRTEDLRLSGSRLLVGTTPWDVVTTSGDLSTL
jgi:hypothetical protein